MFECLHKYIFCISELVGQLPHRKDNSKVGVLSPLLWSLLFENLLASQLKGMLMTYSSWVGATRLFQVPANCTMIQRWMLGKNFVSIDQKLTWTSICRRVLERNWNSWLKLIYWLYHMSIKPMVCMLHWYGDQGATTICASQVAKGITTRRLEITTAISTCSTAAVLDIWRFRNQFLILI